ncbi:hypothetical protein N7478_008952 [Penicillium angulare]|uniref:uncharacterized protein n=1 Tax=Penicillium angulare TaxID=116970 RepID=UPI002540499E|nr:uncharacterized protein N7478_008952 [Penicillium angulare]KAJ5273827.1 hypothetical protein N7478_008952 [Penicillium angulare]
MDPWANVKIPSFESLSATANSTGWVSVPTDQNITYSALTGIPIGGLNKTGNVTAVIQSTYFSLDLVNSTGKLELNGNGVVANLSIIENFIPWNSSSNNNEKSYVTFSPVNQTFKATFEWTQRFLNSEIECVVTGALASGRDCKVNAMKTNMSSITPEFGWISVRNIQIAWNTLLSGQNFSLSEAYIRYPQSPLDANLSDPSTASPSMNVLTARLEQLLNTFFFSTIDPTGSLQGQPSNPIQASARRIYYNSGSIYDVNFVWLGIFLVATIIMGASAVATVVLTSLSMNPDMLGFVSTFIWNSPPLGLPRSGTFLGADKKTRSIKPLEVRFGDVRCEEDVGNLSVGKTTETERVRQGRLYI